MSGEVELVSDGESVVVTGSRSAVERFLGHAGLLAKAQEFDLSGLSRIAHTGADGATAVSAIVEQSGMYLKLTPESAKRLQDAGGLMKTKTKGVSHAMLGETGKRSLKWLQVEDGPRSLLTNPAVLSGVGGLMSQFAQQTEAQELRALLVSMDEKLDDVRRAQRDAVLARMRSAAAAIDEAMTIRAEGGDPKTLWDKVSGASETILNVQEEALLALGALADKVEGKDKTGELRRAVQEIEREVAVQVAVLARCFELQDEFRVVELDHVLATAPANLEGHRLGVSVARDKRRASVLAATSHLMARLDATGGVANRTSFSTPELRVPRSTPSMPPPRSSRIFTLRSESSPNEHLSRRPLGESLCATRSRGSLRGRRRGRRRSSAPLQWSLSPHPGMRWRQRRAPTPARSHWVAPQSGMASIVPIWVDSDASDARRG